MNTRTERREYMITGTMAVFVGWAAVLWAGHAIGGLPGLALAFGLPAMGWGISTVSAMIEVEAYQAKMNALNSER